MLYAVKGNKRLKIEEKEKESFLASGYDIAKVDGKKLKVISEAPGKAVPYAKYKELEKEIAVLKADGAAEKLAEAQTEIHSLKVKLGQADKKTVELEKKIEELEKENKK